MRLIKFICLMVFFSSSAFADWGDIYRCGGGMAVMFTNKNAVKPKFDMHEY